MKIKEANARKYKETSQQRGEILGEKDIETVIQENEQAVARKSFAQANPAAAVVTAAALIGTPIAGMAVTGAPASAADLPEGAVDATFADANESISEFSEDVQSITKTAHFAVSGPGHIEALDNCAIDNATGTIIFNSADSNASFRVVGNTDTTKYTVFINGNELPGGSDTVTLEAGTVATAEISVVFTDEEGERLEAERIAQEQARAQAEAEQARAAQEAAKASSSTAKASSNKSGAKASAGKTANKGGAKKAAAAPAPKAAAAPAPAKKAATSAASKTAPNSGAAQHAMTGEELAEARAIFDSYNAFRASKGLPTAVWSDDCANMAYGSATGCAARQALPHRLGIPVAVQNNYSDILQYSTWKMNGQEAVQRWSQSNGHRKMMQCNTTQVAGVAAYNNNGVWYYAIVYNFVGTNQSGS